MQSLRRVFGINKLPELHNGHRKGSWCSISPSPETIRTNLNPKEVSVLETQTSCQARENDLHHSAAWQASLQSEV